MNNNKILLIEDDIILLNNVKEILQEEGFEVKTEMDGLSGITAVYSFKPHLILCDISIPHKNGYEVLQEVASYIQKKSIPFIFLTAKVEREDIRKGMLLGADDYIFKPFDIDDLLTSIKLRLNRAEIKTEGDLTEKKRKYEIDDKVMFRTGIKAELTPIKEIKFIRAESPYVHIKFANGKSTLQRETLEEWEEKLPDKIFVRIHRSTIINTDYINKIEKLGKTSYLIKLKDENEPFVISKRFLPKFRDKFS